MKMRLQVKLGIIFSVLFIVGLGVMGIVAYQSSEKVLKNSAFKRLHCRAMGVQCRFKSFCCERKTDVKSKATSIYIRKRLKRIIERTQNPEILVKEIVTRLKQMTKDDPCILELFILNPQGKIIASTDETQIGKDKSDRIYFLKGRELISGCTEIYHSPTFKLPTVLAFTPITEEGTGNLLGIGVERISLKEFSKIIEEECALLKDEDVYSLDSQGRFVFGSMAHTIYFGEKLHSKAMEDCLAGKHTKGRYRNYKGISVIGECRWLAEKECALIVELTEEEAFASIYKIRHWFLGIGAIVCLIVIGLTIKLAKQITHPLLKLTTASNEIAAGNLNISVEAKTGDEIELLAKSFNRMAEDLRKSRQKLEEWGKTLKDKVKEKTEELQERVEELEKFNKVAVGRELKMIELKKEIEDLKKRLKGS